MKKYSNIPVSKETKKILLERKLKTEAKSGDRITWDEYLLIKTAG